MQTQILPTIDELISDGAIFFVSHSGGKDSQAMYSDIRKIVPHYQIVVVHADLGEVEWTGVQDHIKKNIHNSLHVVRAIKRDGSEKTLVLVVYFASWAALMIYDMEPNEIRSYIRNM